MSWCRALARRSISSSLDFFLSGCSLPAWAGAFDIRVFIAALIGLYGVIILLVGIVSTSQDDLDRAGGLNINVLAGIGMILGAAAFLLWARLRPVVVKRAPDDDAAVGHP